MTQQQFTIAVQNVNEQPVLSIESLEINLQFAGSVGTIMAIDPDTGDSLSFEIIGGEARHLFLLDDTTGQLRPAGSVEAGVYRLQVSVVDGEGATTTAWLTITLEPTLGAAILDPVTDFNEQTDTEDPIRMPESIAHNESVDLLETVSPAPGIEELTYDALLSLADGETTPAQSGIVTEQDIDSRFVLDDAGQRVASNQHGLIGETNSRANEPSGYQLVLQLLIDQMAGDADKLNNAFGGLTDLSFPDLTLSPQFIEAMASLKSDLLLLDESEEETAELLRTFSAGAGITLTTGFLVWLLKSGVLAAATLKTATVWHSFDPIPVLARQRSEGRAQRADDATGNAA